MLSRFVKTQLVIFAIAGTIGVLVMAFFYMQLPTLLGVGRMTVKLELPAAGGLYRFSNVTYRGVQVGQVTALKLKPDGAEATMSLGTSPKIPADLKAEVRSVSAVGEQYVDLRPRTDAPPYLHDGSIIDIRDTSIPQPVGPMLDRVSALLTSIPKQKLSALLDETFKGFNGAGYDLGSLIDSAGTLSGDLNSVADQTRTLLEDAQPLLNSQLKSTDAIRIWSRSLAGVTEQLAIDDPQVRTLLNTGPGAVQEVSQLLSQIKPTLPVLLANLSTVGQVAVTYHASIEQLLMLLPPSISSTQSYSSTSNPTGLPLGEFALSLSDPPGCGIGFLPPSAWRSPADTTTIDTPDGLYCKVPQDSPIVVRGARNYPCQSVPGKRAPTVQICESDRPYEPLAMRQHATGPYPFDPNLISQGIPPDDRTTLNEHIFGPLEGTPRPGGAPPEASPPSPQPAPTAPPAPDAPDAPPPAADTPGGAVPVAPSSFGGNGSGARPSMAVVQYDPRTGQYFGPDGQPYRQTNLVTSAAPKTWKDLMPT
jgi:phospholipid/cholesterol/gamma-HCH transport system substrate-binding protein